MGIGEGCLPTDRRRVGGGGPGDAGLPGGARHRRPDRRHRRAGPRGPDVAVVFAGVADGARAVAWSRAGRPGDGGRRPWGRTCALPRPSPGRRGAASRAPGRRDVAASRGRAVCARRHRRRPPHGRGAAAMIPRYTLPEMGAIWTDEARFERHAPRRAGGRARPGRAAARCRADALRRPCDARARVDVERIAELERTTDHDVIAFVSQVAESIGPEGRYLHLGLTSSDVVDTGARAPVPGRGGPAARRPGRRHRRRRRAAPASTPGRSMMGRTHSVHAEPITFGLKLASWALELDRDRAAAPRRRRRPALRARSRARSAPTASSIPTSRPRCSTRSASAADPVSTQVVAARPPRRASSPRSPSPAARSSASRPRSATSSTPRSREVQEPFKAGQKGSSAMPHKRNPILSERLGGLARLLRGYAVAGLEDQALWHERDISHSSVERVVAARTRRSCSTTCSCASRRSSSGLVVRPERMRENIERGLGLHASSRVLLALVEEGGLSREDAYAIVQRARPGAPRTSGARSGSSWRPIRRVTARPAACVGSRPASTTRHLLRNVGRRSSPGSTRWQPGAPGGRGDDHHRARLRALRQGARPLSRSTPTACCSWPVGPALRLRRRPAHADPRQGPRPDRASRASGSPRPRGGHRRQPPAGHRPARRCPQAFAAQAAELRGRIDDLPPGAASCPSRSSSAATSRAAAGRTTGARAPSAASALPAGLRESDRLPEPIFTPSTKAEQAATTRTSTSTQVVALVGRPLAERVRDTGPGALRASARRGAEAAGIILADTKFEFGVDCRDGELILIDEVLTPDSSRFWDAADLRSRARAQASYDKQFVRDWLEAHPAGTRPRPGPELPADVVAGTRAALRRGLRAHHRRQLRALPGGGSHRDEQPTASSSRVMPKPGILDPAGPGGRGSPCRTSSVERRARRARRPARRADRRGRRRCRRRGPSSSGSRASSSPTRSSRPGRSPRPRRGGRG